MKWWNEIYNTNGSECEIPNDCPQPSKMLFALISISGLYRIIYEYAENDQMFWNLLIQVVRQLSGEMIIPSPLTNFPEFVSFLHNNVHFLTPNKPEQVIVFLELVKSIADEKFILWKFPEIINDPFLYIDTLYYLNSIHHPVMKNVLMKYGNVDMFFDRLIPFLSVYSPVSLIEFLIRIFTEQIRFVTNLQESATFLFDNLIPIIKSKRLSVSISAFRATTYLYDLTKGRFDNEHHYNWLMDILKASFCCDHLVPMCIIFVKENRANGFSKFNLCQEIMNHKEIYFHSLYYLTNIILQCKPKRWISVVKYFLLLGAQNLLYNRICAENLKEILIRISSEKTERSCQNCIIFFIKKSFEFIALSGIFQKYLNRANSIINFYNILYSWNFNYINKQLNICYSSLIKAGMLTDQHILIKRDEYYDNDFIYGIQHVSKRIFDLKCYLENALASLKYDQQNSLSNSQLLPKPRTPNSHNIIVSSFLKKSKPPITSPTHRRKQSMAERLNTTIRQSRSINFRSSPNYFRK